MPDPPSTSRVKLFWERRVVGLIVGQLRQGITAKKIALTIALAATLGVFPIFGTTTGLCLAAGFWLKLNQPIMQFVNWLISALQLAMILVFVRIGEWLTNSERVAFSVPEMFKKFHESPKQFFHDFGMTGVHGVVGWALVAPLVAAALYFAVLPPLTKLAGLQRSTANHDG
jgi:uncharacterized protein (DUF2062 family)